MNRPDSAPPPAATRAGGQPVTRPARYAVGMFGTSIPINLIKGSMVLFYVDLLGLDVRLYGVVMIAYAVIDAVDNPVLGYLSDRTRTRWGRRRPWLLVGAPVLAVGTIAMFAVPESLDGAGLVLWFVTFAILCEATDSMINANYGALLPELFPRERERAVANALRQGFQLLALVVSLALTPWLTTSLFGTEETTRGFTITAVIYAVLACVVIVYMALGVHEDPRAAQARNPRFLRTVRDILTNRRFWQIGAASACYLSAMGLVLTGVQLYVRYSLGLPVAYATYLQGVVILATVGFLAVWTRVVRAKGAPFTWRLAFVVLALSFVPLFLADSLLTAVLAGLFLGVGYGGLLASNDLIVARVLDEDAAVHGAHREGIFLAAFGFFGRLGGAVVGIALSSLGYLFGYHSGDDPGTQADLAWRVYVCVYPLGLAALGAVIASLIDVPDNRRQVVEGEAATTP
ncbi:MFS transporter [Ornithinimicrobium sp. F0845]|uniref:MFS transporter n=1 Tax=Ornithinimicrobium sp. F0845 TaxID=2926412 RepID=UPI001FF5C2A2|nr:MFS transporter [Ornithinimicrobium sp. F0845]